MDGSVLRRHFPEDDLQKVIVPKEDDLQKVTLLKNECSCNAVCKRTVPQTTGSSDPMQVLSRMSSWQSEVAVAGLLNLMRELCEPLSSMLIRG